MQTLKNIQNLRNFARLGGHVDISAIFMKIGDVQVPPAYPRWVTECLGVPR